MLPAHASEETSIGSMQVTEHCRPRASHTGRAEAGLDDGTQPTGIRKVGRSGVGCGQHYSQPWLTDARELIDSRFPAATAEAIDKCVMMVLVVVVWSLTITGGANGRLGADGHSPHSNETSRRSENSAGSQSK